MAGERGPLASTWHAAASAWQRGDVSALDTLRATLRPIFLRRTKARLELRIPPQRVCRREFDLTMAEKVLHADFVLPAALRHVEAQGTAHGTAQGSAEDAASEHGHAACEDGHAACEEGHAAADASTAVVGYGRERQMILIDSVQRSLLAPSLWASWGLKSKRAAESQHGGKSTGGGGTGGGSKVGSSAVSGTGGGSQGARALYRAQRLLEGAVSGAPTPPPPKACPLSW